MLLRGLLSVLLSSLVGALVLLVSVIAQALAFEPLSLDPSFFLTFGITWLYSLVFTIVIGLPVCLLVSFVLKKLAVEHWWLYVSIGALAAAVIALLFDPPDRAQFWLPFATAGAALGALYWWLLRKPQIA